MTTSSRCLGVLVGCLLGAAAMGCHGNNERLKAFLQEPRSPVSGSEYRVLPPDVILINSIHVSDINNFKVEVRPDGKINLPLLGEVTVAGNTPREIEAVLMAKSREFYEEVDATVQVAEFRSQKIYVFGQVTRPGPLPWTGTDTVIDVLAQVQPMPTAWPERIVVVRGKPPIRGGYLRPSKEDEEDEEDQEDQAEKSEPEEDALAPATEEFTVANPKEGEDTQEKPLTVEEATKMAAEAAKAAEAGDGSDAHVMKVNMMHMVKKGDFSQNVLLKAGDVVYVPPNPLAAFGLAMQQVLLGIQPAASTIQVPASAAYTVKSVQNFGGSKQIP